MTTPTTSFPFNVVKELYDSFVDRLGDTGDEGDDLDNAWSIFRRPLRHTDPSTSIGVYPVISAPVMDSFQTQQQEPTLKKYEFHVQSLVMIAGDEEEGLLLAGNAAKIVDAILYRDPDLALRLVALTDTILNSKETLKRFGVTRTKFMNNELRGTFVFLATTEFWVETEIVKL